MTVHKMKVKCTKVVQFLQIKFPYKYVAHSEYGDE